MNARVRITLTITVQSPFLFPGLSAGSLGVDAVQLRDEFGNAVLPADQARGVIREALTDIARAAPSVVTAPDLTSLFGQESKERKDSEGYDRPERGKLLFGDLIARDVPLGQAETTRVEIDDLTGAAKTGHLVVVEQVAPFGRPVTFAGTLLLFWPKADAARIVRALDRAARLIPAIGAYKSAGFGAIMAEKCSAKAEPEKPLIVPAASKTGPERIGLAALIDRPILVNSRRIVDNAFVGAAVVPGAVFKGALARKLELAVGTEAGREYATALASLHISHAYPEDVAGDPGGEALPLSIVAVPGDRGPIFGDALRIGGGKDGIVPCLIDGKPAEFQWDWKAGMEEKARLELARACYEPPSLLARTHTRIGPEGVAADKDLFTTIACSTLTGHLRRPRRFLFSIDLGGVAPTELDRVRRLVATLRDGLDGIGRTSASATFEPWPDGDIPLPVAPVLGDSDGRGKREPALFAVVLRTDAVLTDPRTTLSAAEAYDAYWTAILPEGASLVDFCASQHLAGGYLATRHRPWGAATYHPFVVTDAGSVFLLSGPIEQCLTALTRSGLPLPSYQDANPLDWRNCPFVPENGFGAIRANYLSKPAERDLSQAVIHG